MAKLDSLKPCRTDHAVKEAVLTVFIDTPISDVSKFKDLEKYGILKYFKRFEIINQNQIDLTFKDDCPNINSNKILEAGFKYLDYIDGKPSKIFQGLNETNRYYFSFHDFSYIRWAQFKDFFDTCFSMLSKHNKIINVKAYSLHIVDEFDWVGKNNIPYKEIFRKNNKIIPKIFFESQSIDYIFSRNIEIDKQQNIKNSIERIQINGIHREQPLKSKLTISHNITKIMNNSTDALVLIQSDEFTDKIADAHKQNKELIKELFNDEVLEIIHFN